MNFDQAWLSELLELQKKAAEMAQGNNATGDIQGLVMEVLSKWGINRLPWDGDLESIMWTKGAPEQNSRQNINIDISETKNNVLVQTFIPGIEDQNNLSIKLRGDILMITGKCNHLNNDEGSFRRKIRLPAEVTALGAEASYRNGNLTISLPKITSEDGEIIPLSFL